MADNRKALVLPIKLNPEVRGLVFHDGFSPPGGDLPFAEVPFLFPDVPAMIKRLLADPCPDCGAKTMKDRAPGGDLDIVCGGVCGWRLPIDTGPFSLGRRVD